MVAERIEEMNAAEYLTLEDLVDCNFPDCDKPISALGLCLNHYMRAYRFNKKHGVPMPKRSKQIAFVASDSKVCTVCGEQARAKGFCATHYNFWWRSTKKTAPVDVPDNLWDFVKQELGK